jgi:HEAT repeat protein
MQLTHSILAALLIASSAMSAEMPQSATSAAEREQRTQAQAQAQAARARKDAERARKERESERAPTEQESLALAALEGLIAQPSERALPILKKVLSGSQSTLVKRRALFVLSQIHSPEAQQILMQATRSQDAGLREEAIRSIGISGNPESLATLQEIYRSGDESVKSEVLKAWMIAGRKEDVYQAAINAKSESEADEAIRMLGVMGAVDELRKLSDRPNAGSGLLDAYAISGDLAGLRKIAEGNGDVSVRSEAVRKIGIIHNDEARAALREIYSRTDASEIKEAARQGMLIGGDEEGVLALYRNAKTADEKRDLLRTLSMMNGDAALQAIDAALEEKK